MYYIVLFSVGGGVRRCTVSCVMWGVEDVRFYVLCCVGKGKYKVLYSVLRREKGV